jgi:hypothetical protein
MFKILKKNVKNIHRKNSLTPCVCPWLVFIQPKGKIVRIETEIVLHGSIVGALLFINTFFSSLLNQICSFFMIQ